MEPMAEHTVRAYGEELQRLRDMIAEEEAP